MGGAAVARTPVCESEAEIDAATRLQQARESRIACSPVRAMLTDADLDAAYRVQETNTRALLAAGRRAIGRKIGLTAEAVQRQFGVDQPDYGILFDDMKVADGGEVPLGRLIQPKVEAEVALVIERPIAAELPTLDDVAAATAYAVAAIEIVDSRIRNWDIGLVDTVADNASSGLFVLGRTKRRLGALDLRLSGMVLERDGRMASYGVGAACLGHPLKAAAWLAAKMTAVGRPLQPGDVVLTGALGPMVPVTGCERFEAFLGGLGSVGVSFHHGT